ncbi:MAG: ferredoxin [Blastopirellula sp.]|nr:MAG: ferredoxin [Blastopirellula sp.]
MITFTFVNPDGTETAVQVAPGYSVMQAALANGINGVTAECNGSAACATCHAYFDESVTSALPEIKEHEDDMLDFAASPREAGSRLSCQILVSEALEGTRIRLPDAQ